MDRRVRRKGSSLIEMLIAIVVTATVLLGLLAAMVIFRSTITSKEEAGARQVALNAIETLELCKLTDITAKAITTPQGIYTVTKNVIPAVISADTPSVDVTVTVTWDNGNRSIALKREVSSSGWQNVGVVPNP